MDDRRERGIRLLDAITVCINEHPIVGQWIVEILDRKTENSSEKPNNCETCRHYTLACDLFSEICRYEPKDEPQNGYCNECKWYGDKQVCGRCRSRNLYEPKTEPQKRICANCRHLKKHNGKLADWVCDKKGAVVTNPLDRECDEMWERKDEPQTVDMFALDIAIAKCKVRHNNCKNCDKKCVWRDGVNNERS